MNHDPEKNDRPEPQRGRKSKTPSWQYIFQHSARFRLILIVLAVILVIILAVSISRCGRKGSESAATGTGTGTVTVTNTSIANHSSDIDTAVTRYTNIWFDALAGLSDGDVTSCFLTGEAQAVQNGQLDNAVLSYLVKVRQLQPVDLTMKQYAINLRYRSISPLANGDLSVILIEDDTIHFACTPDKESHAAGITHTFVFRKADDGYKILSHSADEEAYNLVAEQYDGAGSTSDTQATLNTIVTNLLSDAKTSIDTQNEARSSVTTTSASEGNAYDRQAAVSYAGAWAGTGTIPRNGDWLVYHDTGGNCGNFVSQCLFAGGIPMDYSGEAQWKWYSDETDATETPTGYTESWTGISSFFDYAQNNLGSGLLADTTGNVFSGQSGDVLQFGAEGTWYHSAIITDVVTGSDGKVTDYLVTSNTTDRVSYPASAYPFTSLRLIHILGYQ